MPTRAERFAGDLDGINERPSRGPALARLLGVLDREDASPRRSPI